MRTLILHREDLRLADNPALHHASTQNADVLPLYIYDSYEKSKGSATKAFLFNSLKSLEANYKKYGIALKVTQGDSLNILEQICTQEKIECILWNRCYAPEQIARDKKIKEHFTKQGIKVETFNSKLWHEPWEITNKQGGFFKVFTPYWKHVQTLSKKAPLPKPQQLATLQIQQETTNLFCPVEDLNLLPKKLNWATEMLNHWQISEQDAHKKLDSFLATGIKNYAKGRDFPALESVSALSPYLALGLISPNQIYKKAQDHLMQKPEDQKQIDKFLAEVCWREFSYNLLFHFPEIKTQNWQQQFNFYPWEDNPQALKAWQQGKTGFPIVDAGMRQLWQTGYMHNRVRMIVASFLIKDLFIDWRIGEAWFWDTLVDADVASNAASWQWVAGCGFDAAPYFRVFNPTTQGQKFDPEGDYIRKWVPELKNVDTKFIHEPHKAPAFDLKLAQIELGKDYPLPLVEHSKMREKALSIYQDIKQQKESMENAS